MEGTLMEKEQESQRKTDIRVKNVQDMMEEVKLKMEDLERWETITNESTQSLEFRLQRLEEIAQQTASHLAVIHRFMTTQAGSQIDLRPRSASGVLDQDQGMLPMSPPDKPMKKASVASARGAGAYHELQQVTENQHGAKKKQPYSRQETAESSYGQETYADESEDLDVHLHDDESNADAVDESGDEVGKAIEQKITEASVAQPEPDKENPEEARKLSEESSAAEGFRVKMISLKSKKMMKSRKVGGSLKVRPCSTAVTCRQLTFLLKETLGNS